MMFANPPPLLSLLFDLIYLHMEKCTCSTKDFNTPSFNLPIPHCTHTLILLFKSILSPHLKVSKAL